MEYARIKKSIIIIFTVKEIKTDIVRGEWGFKGSIITDWSSGGEYMNVNQGLRAGNDLWLTGAQLPPFGHRISTNWMF